MKTFPNSLKLLVVSCTVLLLFSTCKKSSYHQLAPEDLAWIVYNDGDLVRFKNDSGTILTYHAYHKARSYSVQGNNYYEESGISIVLQYDTVPNEGGLLYIKKLAAGNEITLTWPHFYNKLYISSAAPITKTIGGIQYTDIYVANAEATNSRYYIQSYSYSQAAGMVQFVTRDSAVWTKIF